MIASVRQMIKRDKVIGNLAEHTVVIEVNNCVLSVLSTLSIR
jgi:hypothetical protein